MPRLCGMNLHCITILTTIVPYSREIIPISDCNNHMCAPELCFENDCGNCCHQNYGCYQNCYRHKLYYICPEGMSIVFAKVCYCIVLHLKCVWYLICNHWSVIPQNKSTVFTHTKISLPHPNRQNIIRQTSLPHSLVTYGLIGCGLLHVISLKPATSSKLTLNKLLVLMRWQNLYGKTIYESGSKAGVSTVQMAWSSLESSHGMIQVAWTEIGGSDAANWSRGFTTAWRKILKTATLMTWRLTSLKLKLFGK